MEQLLQTNNHRTITWEARYLLSEDGGGDILLSCTHRIPSISAFDVENRTSGSCVVDNDDQNNHHPLSGYVSKERIHRSR